MLQMTERTIPDEPILDERIEEICRDNKMLARDVWEYLRGNMHVALRKCEFSREKALVAVSQRAATDLQIKDTEAKACYLRFVKRF